MAPDNPLIQIAGVHAYYGSSHVLQNVTLDIPGQQVTAIVGRNGVGKTTLINVMMGLLPATGLVKFNGENLLERSATARRGLGFALVPQGRRVFGSLTVHEHLTLAGQPSDSPFSTEWLYGTFPRLAERKSSQARNLSGGEQSMLAIARALSTNPSVVLMDEPTEGLAPLLVETVRDAVLDLASRGLTIILVEQNLGFALDVASEIAIMHRGRITSRWQRAAIHNVEALSELILHEDAEPEE